MRAGNSLLDNGFVEFDKFRLNTLERTLESGGRPVPISPKALDVLIVLMEHRGHIVDKEELMDKVWPGTFVEENSLAFNISVLRRIFAESGASPRYIETVPKRGYRFIAEEVNVPEEATPPETISKRFGRPRELAGALFALALVGILAARFRGTPKLPDTPKLTDKDTIVLADFVNKTGDPVFDGTLRQGLAAELEQSPFLSLVSDARVQRTMRLMKRSAEARLNPELAREVCQRTGSAIVLDGSITSVGSQYVLGVQATNCGSGDFLDNEQVQVKRREDVLSALSQIAHRLRLRFGESPAMLRTHDVPLAEVTTASLDALKAYSEAWKIHFSRGATEALPLFKRATELDPEFAMAHASLGRIYADVDQGDLSAESIRRAWQLRDRTSDREKFFIAANYQMLVTGNLEEARKTNEAWARTYPRDAAPHMMLSGYISKFSGRYEDAIAEASKAIEINPDFGIGYYNLAVNNAYLQRFEPADATLQRASERGLEADELLMLAYDLAFLKSDPAAMEHVAAQARKRSGPESWISNNEASALAYSGRLQRSRGMSRRAVTEARQGQQEERAALWETGAAIREAIFGNASEARERAKAALELSKNCEVEYGAAFALANAGDSVRPKELADDLEKRFPDDTTIRFHYLPVLRAQLALNYREPAKAVEALQRAVASELGAPRSVAHGYFGALYPIWVRGEAYLALRRGAEAAAEFQKILDHSGIVVSDPIGALARLQRGRALALAGDTNKARTAYREFLALWKDADPNLPVLLQAKTEFAKLQKP
ncbi:MAG: winged helix-turn-helix domain-containing protein [Acidobacteriota bacterium]|nr:winged helix-turn-helix domain-containing protein [Acidobacteriota bacterium]